MCQAKEPGDDSTNGRYFDFLDSILNDFTTTLPTPLETLQLRERAVNVLYQFIVICPAALITSKLPMLVPTLVDMIGLPDVEGYAQACCVSCSEEEHALVQKIRTTA